MEEDKLLRFHERLKDFIQKYLTLLLNIVLFFVIIIVLALGWMYYQKTKEKKAYQAFFELIHKGGSVKEWNEFINKFSSTQAGLQATLLLWENALKFSNLQELEKQFPHLKKVYPRQLKENLYYAEAKLYENEGNLAEAEKIYKNIKEEPLSKIVLLDLARISVKRNKAEALKYLEEVSKGFEEGYFKAWALYKMQNLKGS